MSKPTWMEGLLGAIDARDAESFGSFLTDDAVFRFGNNPDIRGKGPTVEVVRQFFSAIAGAKHVVQDVWNAGDTVIMHGNVTYTRHSGTKLTVPFANILKMKDNLIREYLIYTDNSKLFAEN